MIHSIISENDIFYTTPSVLNSIRSSNPYDYIRHGYYLDNAALFGGKNYVGFNCNFSGDRTGFKPDISDI